MASTISVHEYAEPICSACTCCEMSRMRLRYCKQRARAAATSKKLRRVMSCIVRLPERGLGSRQGRAAAAVACRKTPVDSIASTPRALRPQARRGSFRPLLDDGPVIIAGVAGLLEQLDPAVRIVVELGGQDPFLEQRLLLRRAVGIDLDKAAARRQALDLAQRRDQFGALEIVHGVERNDGRKAVVRERQLGGAAEMQPADHFGLAFHQRVFRNVEAEGFEAGTDLEQILDQKALGAADVEDAVARLEAEVLDHILGDRNPAAIV